LVWLSEKKKKEHVEVASRLSVMAAIRDVKNP
jgi:hypothetical protein